MVVSENLVKFVARWEALRNHLYDDLGKGRGNCTIGYGELVHLNPCNGNDSSEQPYLNGITDAEAMRMLRATLQRFASGIEARVKVPLNQNQFDALVSWAFNVGLGNVDSSALLERLNRGEYEAVPSELARWNKAYDNGRLIVLEGLVNRRKQEAEMWKRGSAPVAPPTQQRAAWVIAPKLNIRSGEGTQYPAIGLLDYATPIGVISVNDGWARIGDSLYVSEVWLAYEPPPNAPKPPASVAPKRFFVGVHDLPKTHQIASVWRDVNTRGIVVHAMLASDAHLENNAFPDPTLWREHRRDKGIIVLRLVNTWQDDMPKQAHVPTFIRDSLQLLSRLNGEVDYVQIGNEPDLAHTQGNELSPIEVATVFNSVAAAIKSQFPHIKCGLAPIGWLGWAYAMHPAEYDKVKWQYADQSLCEVVFFHAYSQHLNADPNALMELPQGVFYSERAIENQLAAMPEWALKKERLWVECNPIANPASGAWPDDVGQWVKRIVAYAKSQGMTGIAFFRLYPHDAYGKNYCLDKPSVLAAIREVQ